MRASDPQAAASSRRDAETERSVLFVVDAHVHLHECFEPSAFLDTAHANLRTASARLDRREEFVGIVLLADSGRNDGLDRLGPATASGSGAAEDWSLAPLEPSLSWLARARDGRRLIAIAGHQVATRERLEVLALATPERPSDGLSLAEAVEATRAQGGVAVIPWGAGKWLGRRGALLTRFLEASAASDLFLGDNGGRPTLWGRPRHFRLAERLGIRILPGSDPLPLASELGRVGRSGFWGVGDVAVEHPARDLRQVLRDPGFRPRSYGSPQRSLQFLRNQLALRLRPRGAA